MLLCLFHCSYCSCRCLVDLATVMAITGCPPPGHTELQPQNKRTISACKEWGGGGEELATGARCENTPPPQPLRSTLITLSNPHRGDSSKEKPSYWPGFASEPWTPIQSGLSWSQLVRGISKAAGTRHNTHRLSLYQAPRPHQDVQT